MKVDLTKYVEQHSFTFDEVFDVDADNQEVCIPSEVDKYTCAKSCHIAISTHSPTSCKVHIWRRQSNVFCIVSVKYHMSSVHSNLLILCM
jgi:uncharacterized DUF497 family protein